MTYILRKKFIYNIKENLDRKRRQNNREEVAVKDLLIHQDFLELNPKLLC